MPQRNEKVQERVRQELEKDPKLGSRQLYETAQGVDKSIAKESLQQFHARYVLPIKREEAKKRGGRPKRPRRAKGGKAAKSAAAAAETTTPRATRKANGASDRDRVRGVLLEFARDFAEADTRSDIVKVLSRVDEYVDRIAPLAS